MMINDVVVQQNLYYTTARLNVRLGAGTQHVYAYTMDKGCIVNVEYIVDNWGYLGGGCWACMDYMEKYKDDECWKATTTANLNMRLGAGTNYRSIGILKKGTTVEVIKEQNGWFEVKWNKRTFWLSGMYLK